MWNYKINDQTVHKLNRRLKYYGSIVNKAVELSGLHGTILDVGSGPGSSTYLLHEVLPDQEIVGLDNNAEYIDIGSRNYPFLDFIHADCYDLPYDDSFFDSCFAMNLMEVLEKPVLALQEMKRVTKSGGIICVVDIDYSNFIIEPPIMHLNKLKRINILIKKKWGYDPYVGSKLEKYFQEAEIPVLLSQKIRIDNKIAVGFQDTLLYEDEDKKFLINAGLFSKKEMDEMFTDYYSKKDNPDFLYAIEYNLVYGII